VTDVLIILTAVIISQSIHISKHHVIHLKYILLLFVNYNSSWKKKVNLKFNRYYFGKMGLEIHFVVSVFSDSVRTRNPIPSRDREPGVNAINKAEFIGLASQGRAPTRTRRTG
jgi:hypothetical protein